MANVNVESGSLPSFTEDQKKTPEPELRLLLAPLRHPMVIFPRPRGVPLTLGYSYPCPEYSSEVGGDLQLEHLLEQGRMVSTTGKQQRPQSRSQVAVVVDAILREIAVTEEPIDLDTDLLPVVRYSSLWLKHLIEDVNN